jgi:hypothetical protein
MDGRMNPATGDPQPPPAVFGATLLQRARDQGLTGEELAALLNTPLHRVRSMTSSADLDQFSVATLRALAEHLQLPLPAWLTQDQPLPELCGPDNQQDPVRVQAVLVTALGQQLHLSEIARILGWTIGRAHAAAHRLVARIRCTGGLRLTVAGDALTLDVAPRLLSGAARQRLAQVLHTGAASAPTHTSSTSSTASPAKMATKM